MFEKGILNLLVKDFNDFLRKKQVTYTSLSSRVKTIKSMKEKMKSNNTNPVWLPKRAKTDDYYGLRIVLETKDECYKLQKHLLENFFVHCSKDYIKHRSKKVYYLRFINMIINYKNILIELQIIPKKEKVQDHIHKSIKLARVSSNNIKQRWQ